MATTTKNSNSTGSTQGGGSRRHERAQAARKGAYGGPRRQMRRPSTNQFASLAQPSEPSNEEATSAPLDDDYESLHEQSPWLTNGFDSSDHDAPLVIPEDQPKKDKSFTPDELEDKEAKPTQETAPQLANEQNDLIGGGYKDVAKKAFVARFGGAGAFLGSKNGKMIAGGGAAVTLGGAAIMFFSSPGVAIVTFRNIILTKSHSGLQNADSQHHLRTKFSKIKGLFNGSNDLGNNIRKEMGQRGYKFEIDNAGNVSSLTPPGKSVALTGQDIGNEINAFKEARHPSTISRWKTSRTESFFSKFGISRRSVVAPVAALTDSADVEMNKKLANNVLADKAPDMEIGDSRAPPDETDEQRAAREARDTDVRDSVNKPISPAEEVVDDLKTKGTNVSEITDKSKRAVIAAGDSITADVLEAAQDAAEKSFGASVFGAIKEQANPLDVGDKVCTLKNRLRMSVMIARHRRAIAMLRYSFAAVAVGDAILQGKANSDMVNQFMKRVMGVDENGNGMGASSAFAFATAGTFSLSHNNLFKSTAGVDGRLFGAMGIIHRETEKLPFTSKEQCGVIQNPITQIGTIVVVTAGKAVLCVFSLGAGCAAAQAGQTAGQLAVTNGIKASITGMLKNLITKRAVRVLAEAALINLSFEGILALAQFYIDRSMALPFTTQEQGAALASPTIGGGSIANNLRGYQAGQTPVEPSVYSGKLQAYLQEKKEENKKKSFYARIFSRDNPDSLASHVLVSGVVNFSSPTSTTNSTRTYLAKAINPLYAVKTMSNAFTASTLAAEASSDQVTHDVYTLETGSSEGQQIAVDYVGSPIPVLRDDIAAIDPEANTTQLISSGDIDATTYEPTSERFVKHIENCVQNTDILSQLEFEDTSKPEHDCLAKQAVTIQFKAHLAYLDMLDSLEGEFSPETISTSDSGAAVITANNSGTVGNPTTVVAADDTSDIPCAAGGPGSVVDGYQNGQKVIIRVCNIDTFVVNSQVSKQFQDMINAAKVANISFVARGASGGFRTMEGQINTYLRWCDAGGISPHSVAPFPKPPGETIRCPGGGAPGYSNHQMGFAVDLGCDGALIPKSYAAASANRCFQWLQANANRFGFYELGMGKESSRAGKGYEGWHWSINGN